MDTFKEFINEATSEDKRYVVEIDMYMLAKSDAEIKKMAEKFAMDLDRKYDNKASVLRISEMPFGSMTPRKVK